MRKNKMMRLASGLLVAVLLTTCVISGTFAKYISEAKAEDKARVAKWEILLEGKKVEEKEFAFDLFNTVNDTKDDAEETDVKKGTGETIIAPGTTGSFEINLVNKSEVNAEYDIVYTMDESTDIPIEFSLTPDAADSWKTDIAALKAENVAIGMTDGSATVTVFWRWKFVQEETPATEIPATGEQGGDKADTDLGLAANGTIPNIKVSATVTVTQVD